MVRTNRNVREFRFDFGILVTKNDGLPSGLQFSRSPSVRNSPVMASAVRLLRHRSREADSAIRRLTCNYSSARAYTIGATPAFPHTRRSSPSPSAIRAACPLVTAPCADPSASSARAPPPARPLLPPASSPQSPQQFRKSAIQLSAFTASGAQVLGNTRGTGGDQGNGDRGGWGEERWGNRRGGEWAGACGAIFAGVAAVGVSWGEARSSKGGRAEEKGKRGEEGVGEGGEEEEGELVSNWSGTHEVRAAVVYRPESMQDLERIVQSAHKEGRTIRPVGSAISPNGIALSAHGMVNLALMDRVLHVDKATGRVRVQAGARVEQVVEALRPYGLTLQNYASVREQQIGGFIQVGAHGTGAAIPPVDEQVVAIKLVTPGSSTLHLTPEADPDLFYLARCGLGALGVVGEVELQAIPAHRLREETFVTDKEEIKRHHRRWLKDYQHVRYMWIPHTQAVVVVRSNPVVKGGSSGGSAATVQGEGAASGPALSEGEKLAHVRALYLASVAARRRDELLALDPLNLDHVRAINQAEALYWKLSEGEREGWSDQILGFDCGGQQWVSEVCFKAGGSTTTITSSTAASSSSSSSSTTAPSSSGSSSSTADIAFMEELLALIESEGIPAPAPIEQRWTSGSRSPLSPTAGAYNAANAAGGFAAGGSAAGSAADGRAAHDDVYSWVGIIMYLPSNDPDQRAAITKHFLDYKFVTARRLWDKYGAHEHWAKIEIPSDPATREWLVSRVARDFPVAKLNEYRRKLDPKNVLANDMLNVLFPR
ncbi:unnamed protein product [Closterium sp. Yama58-4]|nr:unnamed protein product [Closterium sp. Yama58-4]